MTVSPFQPLMHEVNNHFGQSTRARAMERRRLFLSRLHTVLNVPPGVTQQQQMMMNAGNMGRSASAIPPALAGLFPTPSPTALIPAQSGTTEQRKLREQLLKELNEATATAASVAAAAAAADAKASASESAEQQKLTALINTALSSKNLVDLIAAVEALRARVPKPTAASDSSSPSPTPASDSKELNLSGAYTALVEFDETNPAPRVRYGGAASYVTKAGAQRRQNGESVWKEDASMGQLVQVRLTNIACLQMV
jgi:hypothetical protein